MNIKEFLNKIYQKKSIKNSYYNVLEIISNPVIYDNRVIKETKTLIKNGYNVIIFAWNREENLLIDNISLHNLSIKYFNLKAPYGHSLKTLFSFFLFYIWCILSSFSINFRIIHCHDVDTLFCGIIIKLVRLGRIKLVYDMHDHPIIFLSNFPKASFLLKLIFSVIKHYVDHTLVVNDFFLKYLLKLGFQKEKITVIMNVPSKTKYKKHNISKKHEFTIFYYGNISFHKGVYKLIKALVGLNNIVVLMAGKGDLVPLIKNMKNVKYLGWISISQINKLLKQVDLIPSLYIPNNINQILASPGKLFMAMANGIPVLVPTGTYQAKIVRKYKCGIIVNIDDLNEIREAIQNLISNPGLCKRLGENGIMAINEIFNWNKMESRLISIYHSLF